MSFVRLRIAFLVACLAALTATGCGIADDDGPARVSLIGGSLRIADSTREALDDTDRFLLPALAKGLVGYGPDGGIEQGLAEAWTVTDDGRSYIFRLAPARWTDGNPVTSRQVARILTRRIAADSRNRLRYEVSGIESVRAMTDNVIEIRLARPASDLLDLLAQPEFAIAMPRRGWGPLRAVADRGHWLLSPVPDPLAVDRDAEEDLAPLIDLGISAADTAVARFKLGASDAVLGGRYQDFPYFLVSGISTDRLVIDPAQGLFGLGFVEDSGFFAASQNRAAIAKAIDRSALVRAFGIENWAPQVAMRPQYGGARTIAPVLPLWSDQTLASRQIDARRTVAQWRAAGGTLPVVRIALPDGVGSRLLFATIAADLKAVGLEARQVALFGDADLRLIDEVAPSDNPLWVAHRLSCSGDLICDAGIEDLIARADASADGAERNALLAQVDAQLTRFVPYVPLASPLRWALVDRRLSGYRPNIRARHPLDRMVDRAR